VAVEKWLLRRVARHFKVSRFPHIGSVFSQKHPARQHRFYENGQSHRGALTDDF
jgi:hypothetical protein